MKKKWLVLLSVCLFVLSACSVRSDAADMYKQENPLHVKIVMPGSISSDEEITAKVRLTAAGDPLGRADFVHYEIQKQDGSIRLPMEEAEFVEDGIYELQFHVEEEGLYYLDIHAGNAGSIANPRRQFIVGELSAEELEALKEGPVQEQNTSGQHH